jgi:uncharacterized membrane protein
MAVVQMADRPERLLSLDVFRGMTVAGMLLVNNPGSWAAIYPPLEHATWHGWTPTDLIFPFFLFIVGITTELSLRARRARGSRRSSCQCASRSTRRRAWRMPRPRSTPSTAGGRCASSQIGHGLPTLRGQTTRSLFGPTSLC